MSSMLLDMVVVRVQKVRRASTFTPLLPLPFAKHLERCALLSVMIIAR
jgi:hypothetical protein